MPYNKYRPPALLGSLSSEALNGVRSPEHHKFTGFPALAEMMKSSRTRPL
jgi:hypothetical protein